MLGNAKSLVLERNGENDGFAERFGVAIPNGSLVFIEGGEGTGKSIFCQRFCYSLLENGHTNSLISTQFTVKRFLRQTASVGYQVRRYLMSGKFFFISTEVTLAETHPRGTFLKRFLTCRKLFENEVIFVDSISTLLNQSITLDSLPELTNFFNRLTGSGKILFVTANEIEWDEKIHHTMKTMADIHFKISKDKMPGIGTVHNLYIEKFNGALFKYEPMTTFSVKPGVGLTIESSGVAF
jgi:flagellar protein FlaH